MTFKHIDTCWYFNKLDHRGKQYEWPCCGEVTECDEQFVKSLKAENDRMREALTELAAPVIRPEIYNGFGTTEAAINSFANAVKCIARAALEEKE